MSAAQELGRTLVAFNPDSVVNLGTHVEPAPADRAPVTRRVMLQRIREQIGDGPVLKAFAEVDRKDFVPRSAKKMAYAEVAITIKHGPDFQVISRPKITARMINALGLTGREDVLVIGAGSGYSSAVVSRLSRRVDTVDIDPELAGMAEGNLRNLGFDNVVVHTRNGIDGLVERAPFNAILVTGGIEKTPKALVDQLAVGGRIVIPLGTPDDQRLLVGVKQSDGSIPVTANLGGVVFRPLIIPAKAS